MVLETICLIILKTSIMASVVALLIIVIKSMFKDKFPASWHYYIWILLIIRLLIPVSYASSFSIFNLTNFLPINSNISTETHSSTSFLKSPTTKNTEIFNNIKENKLALNTIPEQNSNQINPLSNSNYLPYSRTTLSIIWLLGFFTLLTYIFGSYLNFIYRINKEKVCKEYDYSYLLSQLKNKLNIKNHISLVFTDLVSTPCIVSIFKPKILIPKRYISYLTSKELEYILLHELIHHKKKDLILNWIFTTLLVFNWFNPILWLSFFIMKKDCELCCDYFSIKYLQTNERINYGETLIKLVQICPSNKFRPGTATIINKKTLKRRIIMIPKFKKISALATTLILLITVLFGCSVLTDKKQPTKTEEDASVATSSTVEEQPVSSDKPEEKIDDTKNTPPPTKVQNPSKESKQVNLPNKKNVASNNNSNNTNQGATLKLKFDFSDNLEVLGDKINYTNKNISDYDIKGIVYLGLLSNRVYEHSFTNPTVNKDNKTYCKLPIEVKTKEDVLKYFNKNIKLNRIYSKNNIERFFEQRTTLIDNNIYIQMGQSGMYMYINKMNLTKTKLSDTRISVIFTDSDTKFPLTALLVYENGHWVIEKADFLI